MNDPQLVCAFLSLGQWLMLSLFLNCCWIFKYYLNLDYCLRMMKFPTAFLQSTVFILSFYFLRFQTSTYPFSTFWYQAASLDLDRIADCRRHSHCEGASSTHCCSWHSFRSRSWDRTCSSWACPHWAPALSAPSAQPLFLTQSRAISCAGGMSGKLHPTVRTRVWWRWTQLRR